MESKHTDLLRITLIGGFDEPMEIMRGRLTPLLPDPVGMPSGPLSTFGVSFRLPKSPAKKLHAARTVC